MSRIVPILAASLLLAIPAASQVTASTSVRVACSQPAPPDSLVAARIDPLTYLPRADGLIVMECENAGPPFGRWVEETEFAGFGGKSYLRWDGPNFFSQPGRDILPFRFEIETPGDYLLRIHVRHDHPDSAEENDCWVRMDGGAWDKHYNNYGLPSVGVWNWQSVLEGTGQRPIYNLAAGTHLFEISGRSHNFKIDRVHLMPQAVFGTSIGFPESERVSSRPIIGQSFSVEIDDPCNAAGLTPGVAMGLWLANLVPDPNFPCGTTLGQVGELLIALNPKPARAAPAQVWLGPRMPVVVTAPLPNDAALLGLKAYTQGLLFEPGKFVVTDGLDLCIGDQ